MPQPTLAWEFESSNVDSVTGLAPSLSTAGTYAAPSGGTITTVAGNRIHTFTTVTTTSITFLVPVTATILVVAGGGGGGGNNGSASAGGGGGAGELYYNSSYFIDAGTYTVTVGAAGIAGLQPAGTGSRTGGDGGDSVFGPIRANGGGGGGGASSNGRSGGSGGGAGRGGTTGGASVKTAGGFGNPGGDNTNGASFSAAGGGGAGSAGADANSNNGARSGGSGKSYSISGSAVTYASGGTGGARSGSDYTPGAGTNGRGDGGDGAPCVASTDKDGARGGSGIVIISYDSVLYPAPTYVTGKYGQAISFNNQNSISSGTLAANSYVTYTGGDLTTMTANSFTMAVWVKPLFTIPAPSGNQIWTSLRDTQREYTFSLSTTVSTTKPFFFTRSSPTVRIDNSADLSVGAWSHQCVTFSNVGATSSNTFATYYFNGFPQGSANVQRADGISLFNSLQLCADGENYGAWCSLDDLRLFNTALTPAQVQVIYTGMLVSSIWTNKIGTSKSYFS